MEQDLHPQMICIKWPSGQCWDCSYHLGLYSTPSYLSLFHTFLSIRKNFTLSFFIQIFTLIFRYILSYLIFCLTIRNWFYFYDFCLNGLRLTGKLWDSKYCTKSPAGTNDHKCHRIEQEKLYDLIIMEVKYPKIQVSAGLVFPAGSRWASGLASLMCRRLSLSLGSSSLPYISASISMSPTPDPGPPASLW